MNNNKNNPYYQLGFLAASWDAGKTARAGSQGIVRRQQERLSVLVSSARAHSRYFANLYRDAPDPCMDAGQLPVVTKADMMRHFDDWVTDPAVTRQGVEAFPRRSIPGRGRHQPGTAMSSVRPPARRVPRRSSCMTTARSPRILCWVTSAPCRSFLSTLRNLGALLAGKGPPGLGLRHGGHFLGNTMMARRKRKMPWRARTQRLFSAPAPTNQSVWNAMLSSQ